MFDRFSSRALRVMFNARSAVDELGAEAIEPEHVLLGLLDEGSGLGGQILARSGGPLAQLRRDIVERLASGETTSAAEEVPFSEVGMRVLQHAAEEAAALSHDAIGTEHLVLGLLREEHGVAADLLAARGLRIEVVRAAIVHHRGAGGEPPEPPGPPPVPANTYRWPVIPFVPSRTVHILYSGMPASEPPAINHAGPVFSAYGFTLEDAIVRAWDGNRWHVDIPPGLSDGTRFDFLMMLPREESTATCFGLLRSAIEKHFAVAVAREGRLRDVHVVTHANVRGRMLRRYPGPERVVVLGAFPFSAVTRRSPDAPMFPIEPFAVHSVPVFLLMTWFEEMLGGEVIDETGLAGIYGFELTERVDTPDALIRLLRDDAGLVIARHRREVPTLVVRPTPAGT